MLAQFCKWRSAQSKRQRWGWDTLFFLTFFWMRFSASHLLYCLQHPLVCCEEISFWEGNSGRECEFLLASGSQEDSQDDCENAIYGHCLSHGPHRYWQHLQQGLLFRNRYGAGPKTEVYPPQEEGLMLDYGEFWRGRPFTCSFTLHQKWFQETLQISCLLACRLIG